MSLGHDGEMFAVNFLKNKGYQILFQNYHSRFGEIDIIAKDKGTIVFVEVKTRTNTLFGAPLEAITNSKLKKIIKTSQFYLTENRLENLPYRFDAVEVFIGKEKNIEHIENITL